MFIWRDASGRPVFHTGSFNQEQWDAAVAEFDAAEQLGSSSEEPSPADEGYEAQTVEDLRDALRDRGLPVSGTKAELVERLQDDDATPATDSEDEEA